MLMKFNKFKDTMKNIYEFTKLKKKEFFYNN